MAIEENYCIYRHLKPCGEVFYVGIGNEKRPYDKYRRTKFWKDVVEKHGYEAQILKTNLSKEEAFELEINLIAYYGRRNLKTGTLCNLTNGGEGGTHRIISQETKDKISKVHKGRKQDEKWINKRSLSLIGRKLSQEHRKKISDAKLGTFLSEEHKLNLFLSRQIVNNRKIINIETGEIFISVAEATRKLNIKRTTLNAKLSGQNKNNTNLRYLEKND